MRRVQGHRLLAVHALATPAGALAAATGLPGVVAAAVLTPDGQPLAGAEPSPAPEGAAAAGSVDGAARPLTLRLTFDGDEPAMAVLLAALVARGLAVYHFAEERSDLEDIFLRVTTGAVQ
jgi:hypothetical protein